MAAGRSSVSPWSWAAVGPVVPEPRPPPCEEFTGCAGRRCALSGPSFLPGERCMGHEVAIAVRLQHAQRDVSGPMRMTICLGGSVGISACNTVARGAGRGNRLAIDPDLCVMAPRVVQDRDRVTVLIEVVPVAAWHISLPKPFPPPAQNAGHPSHPTHYGGVLAGDSLSPTRRAARRTSGGCALCATTTQDDGHLDCAAAREVNGTRVARLARPITPTGPRHGRGPGGSESAGYRR